MDSIVIVVIAVFVVLVMLKSSSNDSDKDRKLPEFYRKSLLSEIEQILYHRLVKAFPDKLILAQVQVSQIVRIQKGPLWQSWFNKISRKSVDFLICQKDFSIIAAIELDDSSHDTEERKAKDADKDTALKRAGIRIIRCRTRQLPDLREIQNWIHS